MSVTSLPRSARRVVATLVAAAAALTVPTTAPAAIVPGNLTTNPSFENTSTTATTGWIGWQGSTSRQTLSGAPDGLSVARIARTTGNVYAMGDNPFTVRSTVVGSTCTAAGYVRTATGAPTGRPAYIVLRQRDQAGNTVKQWFSSSVNLTNSFQRIAITGAPTAAGHTLDMYVAQSGAVAGDAFFADALTLVCSSASAPSGVPMPVGNLPGWTQIFTDDFTTAVPLGSFPQAVSAKWGAYPRPWVDTSRHGVYDPAKVLSVTGGLLNMYLHTENGEHLVAAPMPKLPVMKYGRYVVRFRADAVPGYKTAWLLWPDSETWPRDGEIDFPEGDLDGTISAFMHRQNGTSGGDQDAFHTAARFTTWHTAELEWTASRVRFILDGTVIGTSTSRIPNTPMHWVLQTETEVSSTPPANSAAGNVQIDWVAVYKPA